MVARGPHAEAHRSGRDHVSSTRTDPLRMSRSTATRRYRLAYLMVPVAGNPRSVRRPHPSKCAHTGSCELRPLARVPQDDAGTRRHATWALCRPHVAIAQRTDARRPGTGNNLAAPIVVGARGFAPAPNPLTGTLATSKNNEERPRSATCTGRGHCPRPGQLSRLAAAITTAPPRRQLRRSSLSIGSAGATLGNGAAFSAVAPRERPDGAYLRPSQRADASASSAAIRTSSGSHGLGM